MVFRSVNILSFGYVKPQQIEQTLKCKQKFESGRLNFKMKKEYNMTL